MSYKAWFVSILTWLPLLFLLSESFGNTQKITNIFGISSAIIFIGALICLVLFRIFTNYFYILPSLRFLPTVLLLFFGCLTIVITLWDTISAPNYVYSVTKLHPQRLGEISIFLICIVFLSQSNIWFQKYYKVLFFFLPITLLLILFLVQLWPFSYFLELVKEDNVIEYFQFLVLISGASYIIFCLITKQIALKTMSFLFLLFSIIFLLLVAGDEISWGQRIFGISSPEYVLENNRQKEITVHNTYAIEWLVDIIFVAIGFIGGLTWLCIPFFQKKSFFRIFIPPSYLCLFFLIPGVYYLYPFFMKHIFHQWSEVMELILYMGIVLYLSTVSTTLLAKKR